MNRLILFIALFSVAYIQQGNGQETVSAKFNKSLESYYALKNALAADKTEAARNAGSALLTAVKEVPHQGFANDQQHQLWMKESEVVIAQSAALAKSSDLKGQRKNFEEISAAMIKLTEGLKINISKAFVQYCPMAKSAWLNEVEAVQNPYYGSAMYDCGEVKRTIDKD